MSGPEPDTAAVELERRSLGQRRVNLIWETTQAFVALVVTVAMVYVEVNGIDSRRLGDAFTLIIALYFVRTNHTKVGGVDSAEHR